MTAGEPGPALATERLLLRRWREADRAPLAAICADLAVMEHFLAPLSAEQSDALIARIERSFDTRGYGLWAVELRAERRLLGFVGLEDVDESLPFAPAVEIGWRLERGSWGRGLAHEAARAVAGFAFDRLGLPALVATTTVRNVRSQRLMVRLGMRRDPAEDFLHPLIPPAHPLAPHVLYRLTPRLLAGGPPRA